MALFTILLGGDLYVTQRLKQQIAASYVIAADSGIRHAVSLNIKPDLWVGDFDSCTISDKNDYSDLSIIEYNIDKDKSDGELAIDIALQKGATKIILCGAFGGSRFDHSLAHIAIAIKLASKNIEVILTTGTDEAIPLVERVSIKPDWPQNTCFSVIAFSDLMGLVVKGAKWQLAGDTIISSGSTHTLSNIVDGQLQIELSSGRAIVLAKI